MLTRTYPEVLAALMKLRDELELPVPDREVEALAARKADNPHAKVVMPIRSTLVDWLRELHPICRRKKKGRAQS